MTLLTLVNAILVMINRGTQHSQPSQHVIALGFDVYISDAKQTQLHHYRNRRISGLQSEKSEAIIYRVRGEKL